MDEILLWEPVLWTARITTLILLAAMGIGLLVSGWKLIRGGGRRFRTFSATLEVFGQKLAVNADLDSERDKQITNLSDRLVTMEEGFDSLSKSVGSVITEVRTLKEGHDVTSTEERRGVIEGGAGAPGESQGDAG